MLAFFLIIFGTAGITWFAVDNNVSNVEQLYQAMGGTGVLVILIAFVVAQPFIFIGAKRAAEWYSDRFDGPVHKWESEDSDHEDKETDESRAGLAQ